MSMPTPIVPDERRGPFGLALKRLREARKISQNRLAEGANVDHSYISRLEAGSRHPTRSAVELIAQALELESSERDALLIAAGFSSSSYVAVAPVARDLDLALIALRALDLDRAVALEAIVLRLIDLTDVSQNRSSAA